MADTTILTNAGRNAEAAAIAGGTPLVIAELAWGDGDRYPAGGETALLSETGRKTVQAQGVPDGTLNQAFFRVFLDENEGPYVVREIGLFDDAGTLIALGRLDTPLNKPIGWTGTISMIVAFSNLENLVIEIDSVSAFVPAERRIDTGDGLQGGGDLSQDRTLAVTFATDAQAQAGDSEVTVISPRRLRNALGALAALAGFSCSWGVNGHIRLPNWFSGWMVQWCMVTFAEGQSTVSAPWPLEFPAAVFHGFSTRSTGTVALLDDITGLDVYRTMFSLKRAAAAPATNSWRIFAIGH